MPDLLDEELQVVRVPDVSAGQWSYPHPRDTVEIPANAAAELLDVEVDRIGQREKRKGFSLIANNTGDATAIHGLLPFNPSGSARLLVMGTGGKIYTWNGTDASWTSRVTGLTAPTDFTEFVAGATRIFRLGQTDNIRSSTDGVTWADEGNLNANFPKALFAIWTSTQRMLAFNDTTNPNGGYYSNSGDPQVWDRTTNVFLFGPKTTDGVTGAIEFTNTQVVVCTKDEMFLWDISNTTPSNWTRAKIADIGCEAIRTMRLIGEDALFLSRDGVRSVLQSAQDKKRGASLPISHPIQDWIDRINWAQVSKSIAWVWGDSYHLAVPIDSAVINSHILVWSRRAAAANQGRGGWTIWRFGANAFAIQIFSTKPRLYHGDPSATSRVFQLRSATPTDDSTGDNGSAISFSETGRRFDFGFPELAKTFKWVEVEGIAQSSGILTVEAQIDGGGFSVLGTMNFAQGLPTLPVDLPFDLGGANLVRKKFDLESLGRGRDIQIRLTEVTLAGTVQIVSYSVAGYAENVFYNEN